MSLWLHFPADAILGTVPGKPDRLDTAVRMAMDADLRDRTERDVNVDRDPMPNVDPLKELDRILRGH